LANFDNGDIFQPCDFNITNCPQKLLAGTEDNNLAKEESKALTSYCGIRSQITEKICNFPYSQKSESLVTKTRFSLNDNKANILSGDPLGASLTSIFCDFRNVKSSFRTFSSSSSLSFGVDNDIVFLSNRRGVTQSGADMIFGERGKGLQNFSCGFAGRQHLQNLPDHNTGVFESWLAMADTRVGYDVVVDSDSHKNEVNNCSDDNYSKDNNDLSNNQWAKE